MDQFLAAARQKTAGLRNNGERALARLDRASTPLLLVLAFSLAVGLKLWLARGDGVPFNSDEAIVALMARHILQGARPVFFYGQAYMGSLDAYLVALGFAVFGQAVWVIRLVQGGLYLGFLGSTACLGRLAFSSWRVGALAALLLAVPTVNVTLYTTVSLGGYGEALLLGNLILIFTFFLERKPAKLSAAWLAAWAGWGFLVGLGLWAFGLTLVYSLPAGLYLLLKITRDLRSQPGKSGTAAPTGLKLWGIGLGTAAMGWLIGSSPWWLYALQHGVQQMLWELRGGAIAGVERLAWPQMVLQHLYNLLLLGSTVTLGFRPPWSARWLALPLLPFVLIFWLVVLVYILSRLGSSYPNRGRQALLLGTGLTLVAGFVLTSFGADPSGRYFLPLAALMALFAAELILITIGSSGAWAWGLVALLLVYNYWGTLQCVQANPPGLTTQFDTVTQINHHYDEQLISFLRSQGETRGYTNYWVSYPLAFHSKEELIFVPRLPYHDDFRYTPRDDRYAPYDEQVAAADRVAYITTFNAPLDKYLRTQFQALGVSWQESRIGDYHVFYRLSRAVRPQEAGLGSLRELGN